MTCVHLTSVFDAAKSQCKLVAAQSYLEWQLEDYYTYRKVLVYSHMAKQGCDWRAKKRATRFFLVKALRTSGVGKS